MQYWIMVHGTYPRDYGDYKRVKALTKGEAARMARVEPPRDGDGELWLNKGFILLDHIGRYFPSGEVRPFIKPGVRALYNHDGKYSLIEWGK